MNKGLVVAALGVGALATILSIRAVVASTPNPAYDSKTFRRSVSARVYQVNPGTAVYSLCVPTETISTISGALSALNPGYVGPLVRVENGLEILPSNVIADYLTIRNAILAVNPRAVFSIAMRCNRYTTSTAMAAAIQTVLSQGFPFEAFDFFSYGQLAPDVQAACFQGARVAGKMVGAQVPALQTDLSAATFYNLPDFVTVNDIQFGLPPSLPTLIGSTHLPLILEISNGATPVFVVNGVNVTEHAYYAQNLTALQRQQVIQSLASQQLDKGFVFKYPVFHPEGTIGSYLDTLTDSGTYGVIKTTMDTMNPPVK